jgi:hypothetical protein
MSDSKRIFRLTWLTTNPPMRGSWVVNLLSLIMITLAALSLITGLALSEPGRGVAVLSAALFLSFGATVVQAPARVGYVELTDDTLAIGGWPLGRFGRRQIRREAVRRAEFAPITGPPRWLPFAWGMVELVCAAGALSAAWGAGGGHWYWLAGLTGGFSLWPLMAARWRAAMSVFVLYERPGTKKPGLIRGWATPHQAGSLINALRGKMDFEAQPGEQSSAGS